jgi:hypothetical protein
MDRRARMAQIYLIRSLEQLMLVKKAREYCGLTKKMTQFLIKFKMQSRPTKAFFGTIKKIKQKIIRTVTVLLRS